MKTTNRRTTGRIAASAAALYRRALKEMRKRPSNVERALWLLTRSLKLGEPKAAYALGTWYLHGTNVKRELPEAMRLLRIAADSDIPEALFDLAVAYERGIGVRRNLKHALRLYTRAALWGDTQAVYEVGRCHYHGIGTRCDEDLSAIWLDRAKSLGVSSIPRKARK